MFHPTRPRVRWSRVAARRVKLNRCSWITELVHASPRCSVAAASADSITDGSCEGICSPSVAKMSQSPR